MVMAWWSGIGVEVDAIVDDGIEEMVMGSWWMKKRIRLTSHQLDPWPYYHV
jgi:hypothetical protein